MGMNCLSFETLNSLNDGVVGVWEVACCHDYIVEVFLL